MICEDIEIAVARFYNVRQSLIVPNASWGADVHECDLLICSNANYLTEIEIKVSKSDIKKDLQKRHKHRSDKIKRLYFAMPESLFFKKGVAELIPEHAGIILVKEICGTTHDVTIERPAKNNVNAHPIGMEEKYNLARLAGLRIWSLKERLQKVRQAMR